MSAALKLVHDTLPCPAPALSTVALYEVHDGARDLVAEVEFNPDECVFSEALLDAGYPELCYAHWEKYPLGQYRRYVAGYLTHVAEVTP